MEKRIHGLVTEIIKQGLQKLKWDAFVCPSDNLDMSKDSRFGDISSTIALRLSKVLKKSPFDVARQLLEAIKEAHARNPQGSYIEEIRMEGGGFINFYLRETYFYDQLRLIIQQAKAAFQADIPGEGLLLIEFVSANPTGALSVAHARQAVVGDVLANIMEFLGRKVTREYYLNDEGNQINILGNSVALRQKELNGEKVEFPENYYQGDYIYDIARKVQEENDPGLNLAEYAMQYILAIIKQELDDFGVRFDFWYSQKELRESGKIEAALELLKSKGLVYEKEGAWWLASTRFGDDKDRVVIKSDGSYTYLAPDIAYHGEKYKRGFTQLINLWGPDHHGYINRLKAAVEALGYSPDSLSIIIVQLATIFRGGKIVEMSTRKGQYITLREVLDEVGSDAARFFFLMRRTSSHLDFDLAVAKKQSSENPVYYVQYAHARISGILRQGGKLEPLENIDFALLKAEEEIILMKKLVQLPYVLAICCKTEDPSMLTGYLQETAEAFHRFYDQHRVLNPDPALTQARLRLIEATRIALAQGLALLGISQPEKM